MGVGVSVCSVCVYACMHVCVCGCMRARMRVRVRECTRRLYVPHGAHPFPARISIHVPVSAVSHSTMYIL